MSKSRFKVGDRVKYIQRNDSTYPYGLVGYVVGTGDENVSFQSDSGPSFLGSDGEFIDLDDTGVALNPNDPFERVIMDMVATNRRKRADYAVDGNPWSNFDDTANALGIDGFTPVDSVNFNIEQKSARLRSLRKNGRMQDPRNESVTDTYLDRAVYSVIALAMHTYPTGKVETTEEDAA